MVLVTDSGHGNLIRGLGKKTWWEEMVHFNKVEAKGLNLPSIVEEIRAIDKYLGTFVDYTYFF